MTRYPAARHPAARALMLASAFFVLALLPGALPATTYYVDAGGGNDGADGRTPGTAWRHAPGDRAATALAAGVRLQPGDRVQFRAGVPYRGSIRLNASGTAAKPIVYTGLGWGEGLAIFDGGDPVTAVRRCRSAADCGGAPSWEGLSRIDYRTPPTSRIVLYGAKGLYWLSQIPALRDPFYSDERQEYEPVSRAQLAGLTGGTLISPRLATAARSGGQMELAFWVNPNIVRRTPLLGVEGDRLHFDPKGFRFYENRDGAVALNGSLAGLDAEGAYAVLQPGVLVARLRAEDRAETLEIGNGRIGFNLGGQAHVTITGFHFRNQTASARGWGEGVSVLAGGGTRPQGIEVSGNLFGPAVLESGNGVVQMQRVDGVRLLANRIETIVFGSGLRIAGGNPTDITADGNVIRRVGRTAIGFFGVRGGSMRGNILADIRGVHGNALTAYRDNQDILIEGNCVINSSRPLTFEGDGKGTLPNRLVIRHNILISSPDGQAAINSWGATTMGVRIEDNLLVGPKNNGLVRDKSGLSLITSDRDVTVKGNDTSGIVLPKTIGRNWSIEDNRENLTLAAVAKGQFSEEGCAVPGTRIPAVTRTRFAP